MEVQGIHIARLDTLAKDVITGDNPFELPPPIYPVDEKPVWGLTAKMITELLDLLGPVIQESRFRNATHPPPRYLTELTESGFKSVVVLPRSRIDIPVLRKILIYQDKYLP